jgi:hypothetical protein
MNLHEFKKESLRDGEAKRKSSVGHGYVWCRQEMLTQIGGRHSFTCEDTNETSLQVTTRYRTETDRDGSELTAGL